MIKGSYPTQKIEVSYEAPKVSLKLVYIGLSLNFAIGVASLLIEVLK